MKKVMLYALQFIGAYLSVPITYALGIGNGLEYIPFGILSAVGVWGVGALMGEGNDMNKFWAALIGGAVGAGLMAALAAGGAFGLFLLVLPMLGAVLGYHFIPVGKN